MVIFDNVVAVTSNQCSCQVFFGRLALFAIFSALVIDEDFFLKRRSDRGFSFVARLRLRPRHLNGKECTMG